MIIADIYQFLQDNKIDYTKFEHAAVFTCEEAEKLCPKMPGQSIKNLLLRDKNKSQYFLVILPDEKRVDLKALQALLGVSKLSFASAEDLNQYLGVIPGAVTLLGVINDTENKIEVIIDRDIAGKPLQCHPLVNTATLVISASGIESFLRVAGHRAKFVEIPQR